MKDLKHPIIWRVASVLVMIGLLAWAPWWAILIVALAFAWLLAPYYEIILWGLAYDALYGSVPFLGLGIALVAFVGLEFFRPRSRI